MSAPKKQSVRERLALYQEEIRQKQELAKKNRIVTKVSKLDEEKKDVSKFVSPTRKKRFVSTVSADMVGKLSGGLLMEFDQSLGNLNFDPDDNDDDEEEDEVEEEPEKEISKEQALKEEKEAKDKLSEVLEKNEETEGEPVDKDNEGEPKPFVSLQKRYLKALTLMRPKERREEGDLSEGDEDHPDKIEEARLAREACIMEETRLREAFLAMDDTGDPDEKIEQTRAKRKERMREETAKREQFVEIRTAWDQYEEKAQDRPDEPTPEVDAVDEQIKKAEDRVVKEWADFAEKLVQEVLDDPPDEDDSEVDDIADWINEARRTRVDEAKRRRRKNKAEKKRRAKIQEEKLMQEDKELLEEAKRLREKHKQRETLKKQRLAAGESISDIEAEERAEAEAAAADDEEEEEEYSDESGSYYSDEEYSDEGFSEEDEEEDAVWAREARLLREAAVARTKAEAIEQGIPADDIVIDEDSGDDEKVIEQAKRLRRAHIREQERLDPKVDLTNDEDIDDFVKWLGASRDIMAARRAEEEEDEGDSEPLSPTKSQSSLSKAKAGKKWYENSDDDESDDELDKSKKQAWREEARKLREAAVVKKRAEAKEQGKSVEDISEEDSDEDERVIEQAIRLEKAHRIRTSGSNSASAADKEETPTDWINQARNLATQGNSQNHDPEKDAWLELTSRLREESNARKKAEAQDRGQSGEAACDEDSENDEKVMETARKLERAHRRECAASGDDTSNEKTASEFIKKARQQVSQYRDPEKDAWLALASQLREEASAKKRAETEAGGMSVDGLSDEDSEDDAQVVKTARKLERAHRRHCAANGTVLEEKPRSHFIEEARKIHSGTTIDHKPRKKWYEDSDDESESEDEVEEAKRAAWREEARRLRADAAAKQKTGDSAQGTAEEAVEDEDSGDDEDVVQKALKLQKKHNRLRGITKKANDDDDEEEEASEMSKWLEEARRLKTEALAKMKYRELKHSTSNPKKQADSESSDSEEDDSRNRRENDRWLEEARRLRSEAIANKADSAGKGGTNDVHDEDSDHDEEIVLKARKLQKAHRREHGNSRNRSIGEDGMSQWLEEARRLRAAALAKKNARGASTTSKTKGKLFDSDSSDSEDEDESHTESFYDPKKAAWKEQAAKLRKRALAKFAVAKGERKSYDSSEDDAQWLHGTTKQRATRGRKKPKDDNTTSFWDHSLSKTKKVEQNSESSEEGFDRVDGSKSKSTASSRATDKKLKTATQLDNSDSESESINIGDGSKNQSMGDSQGSLSFWDSFAEKTRRKKPKKKAYDDSNSSEEEDVSTSKQKVRFKESKSKTNKKRQDDSETSYDLAKGKSMGESASSLSFWDSFSEKTKKKKSARSYNEESSNSEEEEDRKQSGRVKGTSRSTRSKDTKSKKATKTLDSESESINIGDESKEMGESASSNSFWDSFAEKTKRRKSKKKTYDEGSSSDDDDAPNVTATKAKPKGSNRWKEKSKKTKKLYADEESSESSEDDTVTSKKKGKRMKGKRASKTKAAAKHGRKKRHDDNESSSENDYSSGSSVTEPSEDEADKKTLRISKASVKSRLKAAAMVTLASKRAKKTGKKKATAAKPGVPDKKTPKAGRVAPKPPIAPKAAKKAHLRRKARTPTSAGSDSSSGSSFTETTDTDGEHEPIVRPKKPRSHQAPITPKTRKKALTGGGKPQAVPLTPKAKKKEAAPRIHDSAGNDSESYSEDHSGSSMTAPSESDAHHGPGARHTKLSKQPKTSRRSKGSEKSHSKPKQTAPITPKGKKKTTVLDKPKSPKNKSKSDRPEKAPLTPKGKKKTADPGEKVAQTEKAPATPKSGKTKAEKHSSTPKNPKSIHKVQDGSSNTTPVTPAKEDSTIASKAEETPAKTRPEPDDTNGPERLKKPSEPDSDKNSALEKPTEKEDAQEDAHETRAAPETPAEKSAVEKPVEKVSEKKITAEKLAGKKEAPEEKEAPEKLAEKKTAAEKPAEKAPEKKEAPEKPAEQKTAAEKLTGKKEAPEEKEAPEKKTAAEKPAPEAPEKKEAPEKSAEKKTAAEKPAPEAPKTSEPSVAKTSQQNGQQKLKKQPTPQQKPKPPRKKENVKLGGEPAPLKNKSPKIDTTGWKSPFTGWHHVPPGKVKITGAEITMQVPRNTECWRKTRGSECFDTAPIHWQEVNGDFEVVCKIGGKMHSQYDKAGIMIRLDDGTWVLSGMEYFDGRLNNSTIVTMDSSDRSVSPLPPNAGDVGIWFCIKRIGNSFECFYSYDLKAWVQTRQGLLTTTSKLHVGICGASPRGEGFQASWSYFKCRVFEKKTVKAKK